jgi:hypothetical protein
MFDHAPISYAMFVCSLVNNVLGLKYDLCCCGDEPHNLVRAGFKVRFFTPNQYEHYVMLCFPLDYVRSRFTCFCMIRDSSINSFKDIK